eukprot:Awhi_evm1s53
MGNSLVIEYTNGKDYQIYDNAVGVLTNSPPYDWQLYNLHQYVGLSGKTPDAMVLGETTLNPNYKKKLTLEPIGGQGNFLGLPGGFSSQSRFTRIALFLQNALPSEDPVNVAEHLLNSVDVFEGSDVSMNASGQIDAVDISNWATIRDLTLRRYYFRSYKQTQWKVLKMRESFLQPGSPTFTANIDTHVGAYNVEEDLRIVNSTYTVQ